MSLFTKLYIVSSLLFTVVYDGCEEKVYTLKWEQCPLATNVFVSIFGKSRRDDRRTIIAHAHSIIALIALSIHMGPRGKFHVGSCAVNCDWDQENSIKTKEDEILLLGKATETFQSKELDKVLFWTPFLDILL